MINFEIISRSFSKLDERANPEQINPGASGEQIEKEEEILDLPLPRPYKQFLRLTRGFDLFGGAVQFGPQHPFIYDFPKLENLFKVELKSVKRKGGVWPPPSQ